MAPLPSPPVPDHCSSTFKCFLSACGCTLQAEQIKNTKTILRAYIHDIDGVYRRLTTAKKAGKQLSIIFFAALASTNAGRRKFKKKKKNDIFGLFFIAGET